MYRKLLIALVAMSACSFDTMRGAGESTDTDTDTDTDGETGDTITPSPMTTAVPGEESSSDESDSSSGGEAEESGTESESSGSDGSSSSTGEDQLAPDLWHRWDGSLVDEVSGEEATLIGAPVLSDDALLLDGESSGAELLHFGEAFAATLDSATIAVRYTASSNTGLRTLVALGDQGDDFATNAFVLLIRDGSIEIVTETGEGTDNIVVLGEAPAVDEPHDIVVVTDTGSATLYVDGEWRGTMPYTPTETESTRMRVGVTAWNSSWFQGEIDDLKIWTMPLSADEIEALR
jgi:hypothetical protein